jgi:FkbM family methyltransferase
VRHRLALAAKRAIFGRRGEPFAVGGRTIRYAPGTRPARPRYAAAADRTVRYDALQAALFGRAVLEGDTAVDIGAHAGQYALIMAARAGQAGTVVAFEPDPEARALLARNVALNPDVKPPIVEPLAVAGQDGTVVLFSGAGSAQSSIARSAASAGGGRAVTEVTVGVTTLDRYLRERALTPAWVKIDAEGAEIRILRGARGVLAGDARIVCELHPYAWAELGDTFEDLLDLVGASGRRMRYLDADRPLTADPDYGAVVLERVR